MAKQNGKKKSGGGNRNSPKRSAAPKKACARPAARGGKSKQRKKEGKTKSILLTLLLLLLCAAVLAAGGFGIAYLVTDGFGKDGDRVAVTYEGRTYVRETEGLVLAIPEAEFTVQSLDREEAEYTVTIVAKAGAEFEFKIGLETYRWSDMKGKDFTAGFRIERTEEGFRMEFGGIQEIVAAVQSGAVVEEDAYQGGDVFELVIGSGDRQIRLGFGIGYPVTGIELDPSVIII